MTIPWNDDFTTQSLVQFTFAEIIRPFTEAVQEREKFQVITTDFIPTHPVAGDKIMQAFVGLIGRIEDVALKSVRRYNDDGSDYDVTSEVYPASVLTSWSLTAWDAYLTYEFDHVHRNFPYPDGWTRKFPREIYKLSYPGVEGQIARFVVYNTGFGSNWLMTLTTATEYLTNVNTPDGERGNAGKIFKYTSGVWVPDSAQRPDVVTEMITGLASHTWRPVPGDYFGPWILNDLRDAINQCVIFGAGDPAVNVAFSVIGIVDDPVDMTSVWNTPQSKIYSASGLSRVDVMSGYTGTAVDLVTEAEPGAGFEYWHLDDADNRGGSGSSAQGRPVIADLPNMTTTLQAKVKTYFKSGPAFGFTDANFDFDAYGSGAVNTYNTDLASALANDRYVQSGMETVQVITDPGQLIGAIVDPAPANWPSDNFYGPPTDNPRGWKLYSVLVTFDFRGYFGYTELT